MKNDHRSPLDINGLVRFYFSVLMDFDSVSDENTQEKNKPFVLVVQLQNKEMTGA